MLNMDQYYPIRPQGFDIEELRIAMSESCLFEKCQFVYSTDDVLELIAGYDNMMTTEEIDFGAEPLATIYVAGIMIYMLQHEELTTTQSERELFLQRCFDFMACTEETHMHQLCEQIFRLLDMNSSPVMLNLIAGCRRASPLSSMAQIVCTCLLWSILDRLTDVGLDGHRFRAYPELMMIVAAVNPAEYVQSYLHCLNLIVRAMAALLTIGPYGPIDKLRTEIGLPEQMLHFPSDDAAVLFRWLNNIVGELRIRLHLKDEMAPERMIILEETCELLKSVHCHLVQVYQEVYTVEPLPVVQPIAEHMPELEDIRAADGKDDDDEEDEYDDDFDDGEIDISEIDVNNDEEPDILD